MTATKQLDRGSALGDEVRAGVCCIAIDNRPRVAAKLRGVGGIETAEMIEVAQRRATDPPLSFGVLEGLFKPKPWQHTAQAYGYLAVAPPGAQLLAIQHAGNISADATLKNAR